MTTMQEMVELNEINFIQAMTAEFRQVRRDTGVRFKKLCVGCKKYFPCEHSLIRWCRTCKPEKHEQQVTIEKMDADRFEGVSQEVLAEIL